MAPQSAGQGWATGLARLARALLARRRDARARATSTIALLEGLVRTMQERDPESARHAAAVAVFARDVARALGMDERACGHVHLAGLLHDCGQVALSDQALAGEAELSLADWVMIERHPSLGAGLLRGLAAVSETVHCHHERLDGRGYPRGLAGDAIPIAARIVAVAEVYDTLTRGGRYRRPMSSFEAVRELRRVAGTQLDADCVEALVALLGGRSAEYRHADDASLEAELDVQRVLLGTRP